MARRFRGSEEVKVDAKGRVSIPAKFRRVFESCDPDWDTGKRAQLVIVYGTRDWNYLQLFTMTAMEEIEDGISRMPRGSAARNLLENIYQGHADEAEIDGDGRLVLPRNCGKRSVSQTAPSSFRRATASRSGTRPPMRMRNAGLRNWFPSSSRAPIPCRC